MKLKPSPHRRVKILWTLQGVEVIVTKGTPQSSYKKTILRIGGRTADPRHVREALRLKSTPENEERLAWRQRGDDLIVSRGTPEASPTD